MNTPNPFLPQGSLLEQNKRRSRMKVTVFCVIAVGVCSLTAMLIQGCKREQSQNLPPVETSSFPVDTNTSPMEVSNPPVIAAEAPSNPPAAPVAPLAPPPAMPAAPVTPVAPAAPVAPEAGGTEYVVVHGDTLGHIARSYHVSLSALEAANPGVVPTRLQVGQKLTIPPGGTTAPISAGTGQAAGSGLYVVKSGDTLSRIARRHGMTLKELEAANPTVDPNHIRVGQKLNVPVKAEAAVPAAPAPVTAPAAAPAPDGLPAGQ